MERGVMASTFEINCRDRVVMQWVGWFPGKSIIGLYDSWQMNINNRLAKVLWNGEAEIRTMSVSVTDNSDNSKAWTTQKHMTRDTTGLPFQDLTSGCYQPVSDNKERSLGWLSQLRKFRILVGDVSAFLLVRVLGQCMSHKGQDVLVYIG